MKQMSDKNGRKILSKYNLPARLYVEFENESGVNHVNRKNNTLWIICNDNRCYKYYIKENNLFFYAILKTYKDGISGYIDISSLVNHFKIKFVSQMLNNPRKYV